jgi:hypothetical protein
MQALSIYLLIRLDEGETQHNDFDFLIIETVAVRIAPGSFSCVSTTKRNAENRDTNHAHQQLTER